MSIIVFLICTQRCGVSRYARAGMLLLTLWLAEGASAQTRDPPPFEEDRIAEIIDNLELYAAGSGGQLDADTLRRQVWPKLAKTDLATRREGIRRVWQWYAERNRDAQYTIQDLVQRQTLILG